ncbi:MAG: DUF983 domain-containing protein [Bacteroidia bacterium]|nr:DUF983 domain-containing protein [Bacteroidia bacterium]
MLKKLKNIFFLKCPRCHEGDLFEGAAYNPKNIINMPQHCPKCRQPFFLEPGFYYGAMYVSYGLNVGIGGSIFFLIWWLVWGFDIDKLVTGAFIMTGVLLLIFPYSLRLSRSIWLHLFYKDELTFYSESDTINTGNNKE